MFKAERFLEIQLLLHGDYRQNHGILLHISKLTFHLHIVIFSNPIRTSQKTLGIIAMTAAVYCVM